MDIMYQDIMYQDPVTAKVIPARKWRPASPFEEVRHGREHRARRQARLAPMLCSKAAAAFGTSSPRMTSLRSSRMSAAVAVPRARGVALDAYRAKISATSNSMTSNGSMRTSSPAGTSS
jgi:hypothetical protein